MQHARPAMNGLFAQMHLTSSVPQPPKSFEIHLLVHCGRPSMPPACTRAAEPRARTVKSAERMATVYRVCLYMCKEKKRSRMRVVRQKELRHSAARALWAAEVVVVVVAE